MKKANRVLIVDDDEISTYICCRLIKSFQLSDDVVTKDDGLEALNYLKDCKNGNYDLPELIFLDIFMPEMDAREFLSEFNKLEMAGKEEIKIILMSASKLPKNEELFFIQADNLNFIEKPLTGEKLCRIFKDIYSYC